MPSHTQRHTHTHTHTHKLPFKRPARTVGKHTALSADARSHTRPAMTDSTSYQPSCRGSMVVSSNMTSLSLYLSPSLSLSTSSSLSPITCYSFFSSLPFSLVSSPTPYPLFLSHGCSLLPTPPCFSLSLSCLSISKPSGSTPTLCSGTHTLRNTHTLRHRRRHWYTLVHTYEHTLILIPTHTHTLFSYHPP